MVYYIFSRDGYWNNELGWVEDKKYADLFPSMDYNLPVGNYVRWCTATGHQVVQSLIDAYEAQYGDLDVWLDSLTEAFELAKAYLND